MHASWPGLTSTAWRQAAGWLGVLAGIVLALGLAALLREAFRGPPPIEQVAPPPDPAVRRTTHQQCMVGAQLFHDVRWAASCMVLAEQDALRHAACLEDPAIMGTPQLGRAWCDRTFAHRDGSAECHLPDARAGSLYALLDRDEQRCSVDAGRPPAR